MLFEIFSARVETRNTYGTCGYWSILIIELRDPTCDVSCMFTNIQDSKQLNICNQSVPQNKADVKICNRLYRWVSYITFS